MSLSQRDLFLAMRARLLASTTKYAPETIDTEGQDLNLLLNLVAGAGEELSLESSLLDLGHYLATVTTAGDDAVDRLVSDLTGAQVQRFRENAAVVELRFDRANTFAITLLAGEYQANTKDGITFRILADVSWSTDDTDSKFVKAICESTGPSGNVDAGTITEIFVQGDDSITVTNPTVASGGRDLESPVDLLARARDWYVNAPRGTLSAIEYGAKQTPGVVSATGNELTRPVKAYDNEMPFFRVRLSVGDVNGQAGTALVADTRIVLQEWRGAGVPVLLFGSLVNEVAVKWVGLKAKPNYVLATLLSELSGKMIAFAGTLGPDTPIERADLFAIAKGIEGFAGVPMETLVVPADDVSPPAGYTNRIRAKDVSFA